MLKMSKHDTERERCERSNAQVDWSPGYGARFHFQHGSRVRKIVKAQINLREHLGHHDYLPCASRSVRPHEDRCQSVTSQPLNRILLEQLPVSNFASRHQLH